MRILSSGSIAFLFLFSLRGPAFSQENSLPPNDSVQEDTSFVEPKTTDSLSIEKAIQKWASKKKSFSGLVYKIASLTRDVIKLRKEVERLNLKQAKNDSAYKREIASKIQNIVLINRQTAEKDNIINLQKTQLDKQFASLYKAQIDLETEKEKLETLKKLLQDNDVEIDEINSALAGVTGDLTQSKLMLKRNKRLLFFTGIMLLMSAFLGVSIYRNYRNKKKAHDILSEKNEEIMQQNEEIRTQKEEIERHNIIVTEQRDQIALQNKDITDSIVYARRIQSALLPQTDHIKTNVSDMFILYLPRNIVSGDYYWLSKKENKLIIVAADCTGHGVPGAFMSMLGMAFLNEIVNQKNILFANEILNMLRENVIGALKQHGRMEDSKDGMDMGICIIDNNERVMQFSGAYNPMYLIRNNEIQIVKADPMPVSFYTKVNLPFTNHLIPIQKNDCVYMFSDGYCDQFGGPNNKKFSAKRFREILTANYQKPFSEQKLILEKAILDWKADFEQTDDILVVGFKI